MAGTIHVPGAVTWLINTESSGSFTELGIANGGVTIREQIFTEPVHNDMRGGNAGPPIDLNYLGEMHFVRGELNVYDQDVLDALRARINAATSGLTKDEGRVFPPGFLLKKNTAHYKLQLLAENFVREYQVAVPVQPIEIPRVGPYAASWVVEFQCLADDFDRLYVVPTTTTSTTPAP
ncbi:hypothetical protein JCM19992_16160 [Thermostilla marina]